MTRQVHELNEIHPLNCPIVAQVRAIWSDHNCFYSRGYIRYYATSLWMPCEHQLVAEATYGVPDGFHVHHIDGDKVNNRASNLAVMSSNEHHRLHGREFERRVVVTCPVCESPFEVRVSRFENRGVKYCSNSCRNLADRKVERPSSDALATLLLEIGNWTRIGMLFGVSDNAVRKWAKQYNLDLSVCDGRRR